NLTATDSLVKHQDNEQEQDQLKKTMETTRSVSTKWYLVHVGDLSPSVSEVDLRSHFQKYQVFGISICEFSSNHRYASLSFKTANKANLAVEEMNGKEIKGKVVNVRLVKIVENSISTSQKLGNPYSENQITHSSEKNIENTVNCAASLKMSAIPSTILKESAVSTVSSKVLTTTKGSSKIFCFVLICAHPSATFIPPNTLNLRSFTKLMMKLQELYPEVPRDCILDALLNVRTNNKGYLSGLSIDTIVKMVSSVLKKSSSKSEKN
uniref:RRM domain-containing protein n=1 Tax=Sphenodon punctatus TaxID=8508 RepID=A0A8D0LA82_SPHPU